MVKKHFVKVDPKLAKNAARALQRLITVARNQNDLLSDEFETINLHIEVNHLPTQSTLRCFPIAIPHSLYRRDFLSHVCLITKDPKDEWKQKVDSWGLTDLPLSKVLSVSKLGTNYKQFKDRRTFISGYDLFLADVKVVTMLPDRLGKYFYEKKKIPALLDLETDPAASVRRAINSTFLISAKGPVYQLKIGRASMKPNEIAENVQAVIDNLPNVFPEIEPQHIRRVELKGDTTLALPIYCSLTNEERDAYASQKPT